MEEEGIELADMEEADMGVGMEPWVAPAPPAESADSRYLRKQEARQQRFKATAELSKYLACVQEAGLALGQEWPSVTAKAINTLMLRAYHLCADGALCEYVASLVDAHPISPGPAHQQGGAAMYGALKRICTVNFGWTKNVLNMRYACMGYRHAYGLCNGLLARQMEFATRLGPSARDVVQFAGPSLDLTDAQWTGFFLHMVCTAVRRFAPAQHRREVVSRGLRMAAAAHYYGPARTSYVWTDPQENHKHSQCNRRHYGQECRCRLLVLEGYPDTLTKSYIGHRYYEVKPVAQLLEDVRGAVEPGVWNKVVGDSPLYTWGCVDSVQDMLRIMRETAADGQGEFVCMLGRVYLRARYSPLAFTRLRAVDNVPVYALTSLNGRMHYTVTREAFEDFISAHGHLGLTVSHVMSYRNTQQTPVTSLEEYRAIVPVERRGDLVQRFVAALAGNMALFAYKIRVRMDMSGQPKRTCGECGDANPLTFVQHNFPDTGSCVHGVAHGKRRRTG